MEGWFSVTYTSVDTGGYMVEEVLGTAVEVAVLFIRLEGVGIKGGVEKEMCGGDWRTAQKAERETVSL